MVVNYESRENYYSEIIDLATEVERTRHKR